jgi:hypothetical protein
MAGGAVMRPRLIEVLGDVGSGRLTVALAWLAEARPSLAAVVDVVAEGSASPPAASSGVERWGGDRRRRWGGGRSSSSGNSGSQWRGERFYPPAAIGAGIGVERLVIVQPPAGEPWAALDAVVVLLRSEAFDVVLCPLAPEARISLTFGAKLATLAARSGTTLFLLSSPLQRAGAGGAGRRASQRGVLTGFADFRVRLAGRRWLWQDGELTGVKLRVATERARAGAGVSERVERLGRGLRAGFGAWPGAALSVHGAPDDGLGDPSPEHELTFRLRRRVRDGAMVGAAPPDCLCLAASVRVDRRQPARPLEDQGEAEGRGRRLIAL